MTHPRPRSTYAPRDVVNAPAIKASITQRSALRGDAADVNAWLLNHFYRHVIGNLHAPAPQLQAIESLDEAKRLLGSTNTPQWISQRLKQRTETPLWWIDPVGTTLLEMETRLVEFLNSRHGTSLQGKLMRVNCPQALALWRSEHAAFEAQTGAGWREHQPTAISERLRTDQGVFVELLGQCESPNLVLRTEMAYESQMMRHCLGQFSSRRALDGGYGEHYASHCEQGKMRLFSFRSGQQHPHITINAHVNPDGRLTIDQIKGKQNRPPIARYRDSLLAFLNSLPTTASACADAASMGVVRVRTGWCSATDVRDEVDQLWVVQNHPTLLKDLPSPSILVQWLVAAKNPELLCGLQLAPTVAHALEAGA
jgi:hypothetical protein